MDGEVTVTVVSVTSATDAYGDSTSTTIETDVDGCLFEPETSSEYVTPGLPAVSSPARVYMPEGAAVESVDHLLVAGERWDVVGDVERWPQVVVAVKRWASP